jgi:hypothetical protein
MSPSPGRVRSGAAVSGTPGAPGAGAIVAMVEVVGSLVVVLARRASVEVVTSAKGAVVVGAGRSGVTEGAGETVSCVVGNGSKVVVGNGSWANVVDAGPITVRTAPIAATIPSSSRAARTAAAYRCT